MSKIKRKSCKSLKEFNKIERKYTHKFFGNVPMSNYNYHTYWYTWIWYDVIGLDALYSLYLNRYAKRRTNLSLILDTVKKHYDWSFVDKSGIKYYLKGIEISNEDYYYIYISDNGDKKYSSCVGSYDSIDYRKDTISAYNKSGELEVECVPKACIEEFKKRMIEQGLNINDYNFVEYVGSKG